MRIYRLLTVLSIVFLAGCAPLSSSASTGKVSKALPEVEPQVIPLEKPFSSPKAELSAMAWYEDTLILVPQYPERFKDENLASDGSLFAIPKADILAYLDAPDQKPLSPRKVPIFTPGLSKKLSGFEGFESIAFSGNQVFLTIETHHLNTMMGYLISGSVDGSLSSITLDASRMAEIQPQTDIMNFSDEAQVISGGRIITFYEANGKKVNPDPKAHVFSTSLQPLGTINFSNIEYRITDATSPDADGRFWAINTFFLGDFNLFTWDDPLRNQFGNGEAHENALAVERLVEFQISDDRVSLTDEPPIFLQLSSDLFSRNWEAIARLDDRGFLIATDLYPQTILAFVPRR